MTTPGDRALHEGAAWLDLSARARLEAHGEDRVRLLHALATMPLTGLAPGAGARAFFLSSQGRIQSFCRFYVQDECVLVETDARRRGPLREYLDRYIIMDDVTLDDVTDRTAAIGVEGPLAADVIAAALEGLRPPAEPDAHVAAGPWRALASTLSGQDGGWILTDAGRKDELIERLERAGAIAATPDDLLRMRAHNRIPAFDDDFFDSNIPHETQQLQWVSFSKGCYIGQEIVERVRSLGQVNKLLVQLEVDGPEPPASREVVFDGKPAGTLTSVAASWDGRRILGFAILRRAALEAGADLRVDGRAARALPWP